MATVINPENSLLTTSKSEITDVPTCVFWLPCDETETITSLTDAVSGGTVTVPSSTASGGGVVIPNAPNAAFSGTLPALTSDFALMVLVETGGTIAAIGYGSGAQRVAANSTNSVIAGADGTDTLDAIPVSTLQKVLIYREASGDAYLYASAPGVVLANTANPVTASGVVTPSANEIVIQAFTGDTTLYGFAVLDLATNGAPADIVAWADWTMEQWAANNKVLPARFKEL